MDNLDEYKISDLSMERTEELLSDDFISNISEEELEKLRSSLFEYINQDTSDIKVESNNDEFINNGDALENISEEDITKYMKELYGYIEDTNENKKAL